MKRNWIDKYFWQLIIISSIIITAIVNLINGLPETTYPEQPYFRMLGNATALILFPYIIMLPYLIYKKIKQGKIPEEEFHNWYFGFWASFAVLSTIGALS